MHTSILGSGEHPTFPAQWLYGLWRDLPGEPKLSCHRRPLEVLASHELDAEHYGRQDHTSLPYALVPFVIGTTSVHRDPSQRSWRS